MTQPPQPGRACRPGTGTTTPGLLLGMGPRGEEPAQVTEGPGNHGAPGWLLRAQHRGGWDCSSPKNTPRNTCTQRGVKHSTCTQRGAKQPHGTLALLSFASHLHGSSPSFPRHLGAACLEQLGQVENRNDQILVS